MNRRQDLVSRARWSHFAPLGLCAVLTCAAVSPGCGGSGALPDIRGTVSVDDSPVDLGTIQFKPAESPGGRGSGAAIEAGKFQLLSDGLKPGIYTVVVQASKKTGKMFQDPQRGAVPQLASLTLVDSPQEIEVTSENADKLAIKFHTK